MNLRQITLRPALPSDEPFLVELRKLTMTEHLGRVGEPSDEDSHLRRVRLRYEDAQIIWSEAEQIGLLKAYRTPTEWVILQVQILPEHQGHGIGADVIRMILAQAADDGLPVSLSVLKGNPARTLYERLGFKMAVDTGQALQLRYEL